MNRLLPLPLPPVSLLLPLPLSFPLSLVPCRQVVKAMRTMYHKCRLVHGDLSEYNMLYFEVRRGEGGRENRWGGKGRRLADMKASA